jgi:hypothetical protein
MKKTNEIVLQKVKNEYVFRSSVFLLGLLFCMNCFAAELIVCIPGNPNIQSIQQEFDKIAGAGKVSVFGRIRDLEGQQSIAPIPAMIVPGVYIELTQGYSASLQGKIGGTSGQKYYIIAVDPSITSANIADKKIAIVDFLGNKTLNDFFKAYFGIVPTKLKKTNKVDDLLLLLGMESVEAIVVSASELKIIKSETKLNLQTVMESNKSVSYSVFAVKENSECQLKSTIQKLPSALLKEIGVDGWEAK